MEILVYAEAPGADEDEQNTQLIGESGQLLREVLGDCGFDLDRDCRKTNAVRCRPPENRKPTALEIATCQPHFWAEVAAHPPKVILLLGQVAVESFLWGRFKQAPGSIGRWRGFAIPDQRAQAWVCPTFHPAYILRSRTGRAIRGKAEPVQSVEERTFRADVASALTLLRVPFPVAPVPKVVTVTARQSDEITHVLRSLHRVSPLAIDYETTGLRPWSRPDHHIISAGVCWGSTTMAFPMEAGVEEWKCLLADPQVRKVAHNMKFEHQWAAHCLGTETQGWVWDSMIAAHMVDNRKNICGLKHQAYLNFGVENWGDDIEFDGDADFNATGHAEADADLLHYNALDAYWCLRLFHHQRKQFKQSP